MSKIQDAFAGHLTLSEFLRVASEFQLGALPTEQIHPKTRKLSDWCMTNPALAARTLWEIDLQALQVIFQALPQIQALQLKIHEVWKTGGRVFLGGCGATGRLSLSIETLYREKTRSDAVVGFMAGGDYALIKSIESFEDYSEYGAKQLSDLGFSTDDLMIGITEGGETPFVIGSTEAATFISKHSPYFLYCNPDAILEKYIERSRRIIRNPKIQKINLTVGPMAISGSTRLQASTVLMMAVGMAILQSPKTLLKSLDELEQSLKSMIADTKWTTCWTEFSKIESQIYQDHRYLVYETENYGITVLTDITERSPTFSLRPIENKNDVTLNPALCSLVISGAKDAESAWNQILLRSPRVLNWPGFSEKYGWNAFLGFDLGRSGFDFREKVTGSKNAILKIEESRNLSGDPKMTWSLEGMSLDLLAFPRDLLARHLLLKILLNSQSILVMGRMNRFQGNVMLYVRPTNFKLVDRAIRYSRSLLSEKNCYPSYEETAAVLFQVIADLDPDSSAVLEVVRRLSE
jgi:N-acetylmuramic acid 6-phosphate etherase